MIELPINDQIGTRGRHRQCTPFVRGSRYFFLPGAREGFGGGGMVRVRYHCWTIATKLLESIYNVRPLGESANMPPIINGIRPIIFACAGSMPGVGVIFWTRNIVAATTIGRMEYGSRAERSWTYPIQGAWRNSMVFASMRYRPNQIGIWISMGQQLPSGLMPSREYTAMTSLFISAFFGSRIEYFLYFSLIDLTSGATFCIFSIARMLFTFSGNITILMAMVITTIAQP